MSVRKKKKKYKQDRIKSKEEKEIPKERRQKIKLNKFERLNSEEPRELRVISPQRSLQRRAFIDKQVPGRQLKK